LHFFDASCARVHHSAANVRSGQALAAMGRSWGGLTTKIHARCHGRECAVHLLLRALLIEGGIFLSRRSTKPAGTN